MFYKVVYESPDGTFRVIQDKYSTQYFYPQVLEDSVLSPGSKVYHHIYDNNGEKYSTASIAVAIAYSPNYDVDIAHYDMLLKEKIARSYSTGNWSDKL